MQRKQLHEVHPAHCLCARGKESFEEDDNDHHVDIARDQDPCVHGQVYHGPSNEDPAPPELVG